MGGIGTDEQDALSAAGGDECGDGGGGGGFADASFAAYEDEFEVVGGDGLEERVESHVCVYWLMV